MTVAKPHAAAREAFMLWLEGVSLEIFDNLPVKTVHSEDLWIIHRNQNINFRKKHYILDFLKLKFQCQAIVKNLKS